eukprot:jgi/Mesvir1/24240/Mv10945-RA.2
MSADATEGIFPRLWRQVAQHYGCDESTHVVWKTVLQQLGFDWDTRGNLTRRPPASAGVILPRAGDFFARVNTHWSAIPDRAEDDRPAPVRVPIEQNANGYGLGDKAVPAVPDLLTPSPDARAGDASDWSARTSPPLDPPDGRAANACHDVRVPSCPAQAHDATPLPRHATSPKQRCRSPRLCKCAANHSGRGVTRQQILDSNVHSNSCPALTATPGASSPIDLTVSPMPLPGGNGRWATQSLRQVLPGPTSIKVREQAGWTPCTDVQGTAGPTPSASVPVPDARGPQEGQGKEREVADAKNTTDRSPIAGLPSVASLLVPAASHPPPLVPSRRTAAPRSPPAASPQSALSPSGRATNADDMRRAAREDDALASPWTTSRASPMQGSPREALLLEGSPLELGRAAAMASSPPCETGDLAGGVLEMRGLGQGMSLQWAGSPGPSMQGGGDEDRGMHGRAWPVKADRWTGLPALPSSDDAQAYRPAGRGPDGHGTGSQPMGRGAGDRDEGGHAEVGREDGPDGSPLRHGGNEEEVDEEVQEEVQEVQGDSCCSSPPPLPLRERLLLAARRRAREGGCAGLLGSGLLQAEGQRAPIPDSPLITNHSPITSHLPAKSCSPAAKPTSHQDKPTGRLPCKRQQRAEYVDEEGASAKRAPWRVLGDITGRSTNGGKTGVAPGRDAPTRCLAPGAKGGPVQQDSWGGGSEGKTVTDARAGAACVPSKVVWPVVPDGRGCRPDPDFSDGRVRAERDLHRWAQGDAHLVSDGEESGAEAAQGWACAPRSTGGLHGGNGGMRGGESSDHNHLPRPLVHARGDGDGGARDRGGHAGSDGDLGGSSDQEEGSGVQGGMEVSSPAPQGHGVGGSDHAHTGYCSGGPGHACKSLESGGPGHGWLGPPHGPSPPEDWKLAPLRRHCDARVVTGSSRESPLGRKRGVGGPSISVCSVSSDSSAVSPTGTRGEEGASSRGGLKAASCGMQNVGGRWRMKTAPAAMWTEDFTRLSVAELKVDDWPHLGAGHPAPRPCWWTVSSRRWHRMGKVKGSPPQPPAVRTHCTPPVACLARSHYRDRPPRRVTAARRRSFECGGMRLPAGPTWAGPSPCPPCRMPSARRGLVGARSEVAATDVPTATDIPWGVVDHLRGRMQSAGRSGRANRWRRRSGSRG